MDAHTRRIWSHSALLPFFIIPAKWHGKRSAGIFFARGAKVVGIVAIRRGLAGPGPGWAGAGWERRGALQIEPMKKRRHTPTKRAGCVAGVKDAGTDYSGSLTNAP